MGPAGPRRPGAPELASGESRLARRSSAPIGPRLAAALARRRPRMPDETRAFAGRSGPTPPPTIAASICRGAARARHAGRQADRRVQGAGQAPREDLRIPAKTSSFATTGALRGRNSALPRAFQGEPAAPASRANEHRLSEAWRRRGAPERGEPRAGRRRAPRRREETLRRRARIHVLDCKETSD